MSQGDEPPKRGRGRPKGSKDSKPRRAPSRAVKQLEDEVGQLKKAMEKLVEENRQLQRGYEAQPLKLVRNPDEPLARGMSEEQLNAIANAEDMPEGEIPFTGTDDEMDALQYRRAQVARLLLRGVPHKTIAEHLKVRPSTLKADINAIRRKWRNQVNGYDIAEHVGESLAFYREMRDIGLRLATDPTVEDDNTKLNAARSALAAEDSKNRFLQMLGVYDILDKERREAFVGEGANPEADQEDFHKVISFMAHARNVQTELIEDAEYDDIESPDTGDQ